MRRNLSWIIFVLLCAGASRMQACAVFSGPVIYRMPHALIDFDVGPQALAANGLAHRQFVAASAQARRLGEAINELLTPNLLDWAALGVKTAGPELRINACPLNEAVIDAVRGAPLAGLVDRVDLPMTRASLLAQDQSTDEANVTTGWNAIELLLWGQDFNPDGPGQRSATDFSGHSQANQRRTYSKLLVERLIEDLTLVSCEWDKNVDASDVNKPQQLPAIKQLGRVLHGATTLLITEVHEPRLTVPRHSATQKDEHSCFSDFTLEDLNADLAGIRSVFYTELKGAPESSLIALMRWKDPKLAQLLQQKLDLTQALEKIPEPFDQMLLSAPNTPARVQAEAAARARQSLGAIMKAVAENLGIQIVVPGVKGMSATE